MNYFAVKHNKAIIMATHIYLLIFSTVISISTGVSTDIEISVVKSPPPPDSSCPWVGLDCLFHDIVMTGNIQ